MPPSREARSPPAGAGEAPRFWACRAEGEPGAFPKLKRLAKMDAGSFSFASSTVSDLVIPLSASSSAPSSSSSSRAEKVLVARLPGIVTTASRWVERWVRPGRMDEGVEVDGADAVDSLSMTCEMLGAASFACLCVTGEAAVFLAFAEAAGGEAGAGDRKRRPERVSTPSIESSLTPLAFAFVCLLVSFLACVSSGSGDFALFGRLCFGVSARAGSAAFLPLFLVERRGENC